MNDKQKAKAIRKMARMFDVLGVSYETSERTSEELRDGLSDNQRLAEMAFEECLGAYLHNFKGLEMTVEAILGYTEKVSDGYAFLRKQYEIEKDDA